MSILGNRVLRTEDPKFLTTGGVYLADLVFDGAVTLTYVRSTMAHARITGIDVEEARTAPGVVAVFTNADLTDLTPLPPEVPMLNQKMTRTWLADDIVRYVGEPVAVVVAETRPQGVDAAELVFVDYDPLPAVVDPVESLRDEVILHEDAGTNVSLELHFGYDEHLFDDCDVVVRRRIRNNKVAPCPLETRAAASRWEGDHLTHWATTQSPHSAKGDLCRHLGLEPEQVRVIAPDVGGGFGAKIGTYPEELLVPWVARRVGRPAVWVETRSESMLGLGHGRGQLQLVEIGGSRDGTIEAYRLTVLQDTGAYARIGAVLPFMTRMMLTGVYALTKAEFNATSVVTNTVPLVAYRGAGRPEAAAAIERAVDLFATEIGVDPAEVRRRSFLASDVFPYMTPTGTSYDSGDYGTALEKALEAAGYDELRAEQRRRREAGDTVALGIGLAVYVEVTGGNPGEFAAIEVKADGTAEVRTGTSPHGQGHETAWAMLAAEQTGIPMSKIKVIHGDTDLVPRGGGTMGSRSLQVGGVAVHRASIDLVAKARELAADLLEAAPEDVVLDKPGGRFHVAGTPAIAKEWADVVAAAGEGGLAAEVDFKPEGSTFPFGAHVCVVEVDTETGRVKVRRMVAVDDAGVLLNPLLAEGQVHGGLAQGVAQALLEEVVYDADGNPVTANLADYAFVSAAELPSFERVEMVTPTPLNDLGAKGIGESGSIGSTPAVHNAVVDALAHLGVRHVDMPCTPERVWRAIESARGGGSGDGDDVTPLLPLGGQADIAADADVELA